MMNFLYLTLWLIFIFWIFFVIFREKIIFILKFKKFYFSTIFLLVSFIFSFSAILDYAYFSVHNEKSKSSDILFLLDVSESMNALDYKKWQEYYSRLQVSKEFIKNYMIKNPQNRYSLSIFSWDYIDVIPFTHDLDLFLNFLDTADSKSIIKWWNVFKEALESSLKRFESEKTSGWVIVFSDFEFPWKSKDFLKTYIDNLNWLKKDINWNNIKIFNIWVWKTNWSRILTSYDLFWWPIFKKDSFWNDVLTKFDLESFKNISSTLWASSFILEDFFDSKSIISKIKDIPSSEKTFKTDKKSYFSRYLIIVSYLFFLLFMFFYFFEKRKSINFYDKKL